MNGLTLIPSLFAASGDQVTIVLGGNLDVRDPTREAEYRYFDVGA